MEPEDEDEDEDEYIHLDGDIFTHAQLVFPSSIITFTTQYSYSNQSNLEGPKYKEGIMMHLKEKSVATTGGSGG
jgi:hypothetical protein